MSDAGAAMDVGLVGRTGRVWLLLASSAGLDE